MENVTDEQLLDFIDGIGNTEEKERIKKIINANDTVLKRMKELQLVHHYFQQQNKIEVPSGNFTDKVMSSLHTRQSFSFLSPKNGLLLLVGLMVASCLAIMLASSVAFDQWHPLLQLNTISLNNSNWVKIPNTVPLNLKLMVNLFVILNLIVGFVLIDRTILRPIFQKRAERFN